MKMQRWAYAVTRQVSNHRPETDWESRNLNLKERFRYGIGNPEHEKSSGLSLQRNTSWGPALLLFNTATISYCFMTGSEHHALVVCICDGKVSTCLSKNPPWRCVLLF